MNAADRASNRRHFLTGRSARDEIVDRLPARSNLLGSAPPLMHLTRKAMACGFSIFLDARSTPEVVNAAMRALDLLEELEQALSIYRDDSEISRLNRSPGRRVQLSPPVFDLLRQAKHLHVLTLGAFDVTAGPLARIWGFATRSPRQPGDDEIAEALDHVGSESLALEPDGCWARTPESGMEINLGAIGKGYALDRCATMVRDAGGEDFLMHGGLSSILAAGHRMPRKSKDDPTPLGWDVEIKHPASEKVIARVRLQDRALGTSGSSHQHLVDATGQQLGHIIDPRTGRPATPLISVSAIAREAAQADALATAFYVMGSEPTREFCDRHPEYGAVIVVPTDASPGYRIELAGEAMQCVSMAPE